MSNKVKLPARIIDILIDFPEQGMGYQIVNIILKDKTILKNRKVVNSTYLLLLDNEQINTTDILNVEINKEMNLEKTSNQKSNSLIKRANFIVGFNNWGKTTIIKELFGKSKFSPHLPHKLKGISIPVQFIVQSQSNDDLGVKFIKNIKMRIQRTKNPKLDLIAALCPSMEINNDFRQILQDTVFSDFHQINLFLIKYKWEHHAELLINEIKESLKGQPKFNLIIIDADNGLLLSQRKIAKVEQIRKKLIEIYL